MKKLLLLCLFSASLYGANHPVPLTANQETKAARLLAFDNKEICLSAGFNNGVCTAEELLAKDPSKQLHIDVDGMIKSVFIDYMNLRLPKADESDEQNTFRDIKRADAAKKDQICAILGKPAGCIP